MAKKNKFEAQFEDKSLFNGDYYFDVLIDTDAFVALIKKNDNNHKRAEKISDFLTKKSSSFYTTNFVFSETITVLSQRVDHQTAINFIDDFKNLKEVNLIRVNEEIEEMAIKIFKNQISKNVSFVDCINMAVLKRYKWNTIFSFDKVYRKNGFKPASVLKF